MHGLANEGDRYFNASEVFDALRVCGRQSPGLAANFVMVGQGPELNTVFCGPLRQRFGCQRAVGYYGMAMKIGVLDGSHTPILGQPPCAPGVGLR